jgi:hypothetical protein
VPRNLNNLNSHGLFLHLSTFQVTHKLCCEFFSGNNVVVNFSDRGYPGMLAVSSHLLPEVGGGDLVRREVFGDLVDASCLSHKDYAQLLQQVVGISGNRE